MSVWRRFLNALGGGGSSGHPTALAGSAEAIESFGRGHRARLPDSTRPGRPPAGANALEGFDRSLALLARRGRRIRTALAEVGALRAELTRRLATLEQREARLVEARDQALRDGSSSTLDVLEADLRRTREQVVAMEAEREELQREGRLLRQQGAALEEERRAVEQERIAARARGGAARAVARALDPRERFETELALDAARDELARVQALLELHDEGSVPG